MSNQKDEDDLDLQENEETGAEDENDESESEELFSCKYCEYRTRNISVLDEHIISHGEALLEDSFEEDDFEATKEEKHVSPKFKTSPFSNEGSSSPQAIYSLKPQTKRMKQSLPAFYEEFKNKMDKRAFVCPYCGYQSMKKLDMSRHLEIHSNPIELPVYACAECAYTTRRKCDMPKHLLTHCKDGSVFMYTCPHCPYATKRKGDLPKHMICHSKEENVDLFSCNRCSYSSKRQADVKKHQLSHNCTGERDKILYNCTECGYTSKRLNDLHKHVVLHCDKAVKGIMKCPKCDYATHVSNHFAKHVLSNCRVTDMGVAIFPKDSETMQDYIVLDEDELQLYQLDKEAIASVQILEKDQQELRSTKKRKRSKDNDFISTEQADLDNYYIENTETLEANLLDNVNSHDEHSKVVVLTGYEDHEKADS